MKGARVGVLSIIGKKGVWRITSDKRSIQVAWYFSAGVVYWGLYCRGILQCVHNNKLL